MSATEKPPPTRPDASPSPFPPPAAVPRFDLPNDKADTEPAQETTLDDLLAAVKAVQGDVTDIKSFLSTVNGRLNGAIESGGALAVRCEKLDETTQTLTNRVLELNDILGKYIDEQGGKNDQQEAVAVASAGTD